LNHLHDRNGFVPLKPKKVDFGEYLHVFFSDYYSFLPRQYKVMQLFTE
jgi:hypothetical protein